MEEYYNTPETESRAPKSGLSWTLMLIMMALFFAAGIAFSEFVLNRSAPGEGLNTQLMDEARTIIKRNFVLQEDVTDEVLTFGALTGMVDSLGDVGHSRFMDPQMVEEQSNYTAGQFEGIGAYVEMRDGFVTIVTPIDNSPAKAAGVLPGDVVLRVDGEDVTGQSLQDVVNKIIGPAGTDVTVTFFRPETGEELVKTITRARIDLENVTWTMLPESDLAFIRVSAFSQGIGQDVADAISAAEALGATGVVLDLRNNPGGLLNEAVTLAGQFLPEESVVVLRQDAEGNTSEEKVRPGATPTDLPVVVLINEGSASASEIVSGALQDAGRATLIGETTFGTGTVLNQFGLSDGSAMLLATELWLTPAGRVIWRQGVEPDELVELPVMAGLVSPDEVETMTGEELVASDDEQLLRAMTVLQEKIASSN